MYNILDLNGTTYIEIDVSMIPELADKVNTPLTRVRAGSYKKLSYKKVDGEYATGGGAEMLRIGNDFFKYLPEDLHKAIILQILNIRVNLYNWAKEGMGSVEMGAKLAPLIEDLLVENDLYFKALQFVTNHVYIEFREGVGNSSHDTLDKTYLDDDLRKIYAMMVCCRVMLPIFALIRNIMDKSIRDLLIASVTKPAFVKMCPDVVEKLERYIIANMGDLKTRFKDKFMPMVFAGFTVDTLPDVLFAGVLTSTFIIQDLSKSLVYAILRHVTQARKPANMKYVEVRTTSTFVEEDKSSDLEINSTVSRTPLHVRLIANSFTRQIVSEYIKINRLDRKLYHQVHKFIRDKTIPNPISIFLVELAFETGHLGRVGMHAVDVKGFSSMHAAIITHLIMLKKFELVKILCSIPRPMTREDTIITTSILHGYTKNRTYVKFIESIKKKTLSKNISELVAISIEGLIRFYTEHEWVIAVIPGQEDVFGELETGTCIKHETSQVSEMFTFLTMFSE